MNIRKNIFSNNIRMELDFLIHFLSEQQRSNDDKQCTGHQKDEEDF